MGLELVASAYTVGAGTYDFSHRMKEDLMMYKSKYLHRIRLRKAVVIVESESKFIAAYPCSTTQNPQPLQFLDAQLGGGFMNQQLSAFNQQAATQHRQNGLASLIGGFWG